jgi:hypothetical protein
MMLAFLFLTDNYNIAEMCGWDAPIVYHAEHNAAKATCTILMEDLTRYPNAYFGDQVAGASLDEASMAIRELTKLHLRFWNCARREVPAGFNLWKPLEDGSIDITVEIVGRTVAFAKFQASYKDFGWTALTSKAADTIQRYFANALKLCLRRKPKELGGQMNTTLCHADYRMENLFFWEDPADGVKKVKVFDFQTVHEQNPCRDLVYFLCLNLTAESRNAHELDLLRYYHQLLTEGGVEYPWLEMMSDFQNFVGFTNVTFVSMMANMNWSELTTEEATQKAVRLWSTMSQRLVIALEDWNVKEYLDLALTLRPSDDRSLLWQAVPPRYREAGPATGTAQSGIPSPITRCRL